MANVARAGLLSLFISVASFGQTTRESEPAKPSDGLAAAVPADRSLLKELNRETQGLYRELQGSILRVQVPEAAIARSGAGQNNWFANRYPHLNNDMRQRLIEPGNSSQNGISNGSAQTDNNAGANQAATGNGVRAQNADLNNSQNIGNNANPPATNASNYTIIVPAAGPDQQQVSSVNGFAPNNVGLLLDDRGHVLVPLYVDRESVGDLPIHLAGAGGRVMDARLVGSDQQTGLTVLQLVRAVPPATGKAALQGTPTTAPSTSAAGALTGGGNPPDQPPLRRDSAGEGTGGTSERHPGFSGTSEGIEPAPGESAKPVKLAKAKPAEGSLVMLLSPGSGAARLGVWNGGGSDYGVVVNLDGEVSGITRSGQFLSGAACQLIADQIIRNGSVRRATLGIFISQIEKDDVLRRTQPLLGDRPAVRIDDVVARSVAERGGLKPGDVLLGVDGEPVTDIPSLAAAIAAKDGRSRFQVLRGNQVIDLTVDLKRK